MKINNLILIAIVSLVSIPLIAVTSLTSTVYAQGDATTTEEPKFLAIQNAQSGSISKINETAYSLELNEVSDKTVLFSDRPDRIVKSISTSDFVGNWSAGQDSFAEDAPNAALVVDDLEGHDTTVLELFNPVYNAEEKTIKYDITPDNATSLELPKEFGQCTIVIDSSFPNATPGDYNYNKERKHG